MFVVKMNENEKKNRFARRKRSIAVSINEMPAS